jgi:hypothetical protein
MGAAQSTQSPSLPASKASTGRRESQEINNQTWPSLTAPPQDSNDGGDVNNNVGKEDNNSEDVSVSYLPDLLHAHSIVLLTCKLAAFS